MTDNGHEPTTAVPAQPAPAPEHPAVLELRRVRRVIREHLASAVSEEQLDVELANGMLRVLDLPELPRRWTVRIGLALICEVTADSADDAFDTAEDLVEAALAHADTPVVIDWDGRDHQDATAGEVDFDALDTD